MSTARERPSGRSTNAQRRTTMADVATRAGVSVATVSYVTNGRPGVGDEVRARVLQVADELGYRPNRLAQGLRHGRTTLLGLLLPDIANPYYPELAAGVIDAAAQEDYQVFLSQTGIHDESTDREVEALIDHRCDALVFTAVTAADGPLLRRLLARGTTFVQAVRRVHGIRADFVGIDDHAGGRDVVQHLLALGHTTIGFLHGPTSSSASRGRFEGGMGALAAAGIAVPDDRVRAVPLTLAGGYGGARSLLSAVGETPTALVCGNDLIALGAIDAVTDAGRRVPDDVAVVGYDDLAFAALRPIELTTIHQPLADMGRMAVRLLLERLADPSLPPRAVVLPHRLVIRATSGAPVGDREPRARHHSFDGGEPHDDRA